MSIKLRAVEGDVDIAVSVTEALRIYFAQATRKELKQWLRGYEREAKREELPAWGRENARTLAREIREELERREAKRGS